MSDALAAKLAESKKLLETTHAEMSSLREQVAHADIGEMDSDSLKIEISEKSEQRMVLLNVTLAGQNRVEKLTRWLVTKLIYTADAVAQQYGYDAVSRLCRGLKRAYLRLRVRLRVGLNVFPGLLPRGIAGKIKGAGRKNNRELQKVVVPIPGTALQRNLAFEGLVRVVARVTSLICFSLIIPFGFCRKCFDFLLVLGLSRCS